MVRLPPNVALVPHNFLAPNPQRASVRQQRVNLRVVGVLDHRDPAPDDRHTVAPLDSPFLSTAGIPLFAPLDEQVESDWVVPGAPDPQRYVSFLALNKNVAAVCGQGAEPCFQRAHAERHHFKRQDEALGVGELGTESLLMLDHCAPRVDLAVDAVSVVSGLAQMLKVLGGINTASAVHLRGGVGTMCRLGVTDNGSESGDPTRRRQRLARRPWL